MAALGISSTDFSNLFWLVVICNLTSLLPLPLLHLLPKSLDRDPEEEEGGGAQGEEQRGEEEDGGGLLEEDGGVSREIEMHGGLGWRAGLRRSGEGAPEERRRLLLGP